MWLLRLRWAEQRQPESILLTTAPPVLLRAGVHKGAVVPYGHTDFGAARASEGLPRQQGRQLTAPRAVQC